jgi:hypothetical protein
VDSKENLVIIALQERIGQLVANYETQIAFLRAELTAEANKNKAKIDAVDEYNKEIVQMLEG